MADIKVSNLTLATTTDQNDLFMIVQNQTNKRLTLETLLGNLNTNVTINSKLENIDLCVNGSNKSNLLYVSSGYNGVGIGTSTPSAALQVIGNLKLGENKNVTRNIVNVTVGSPVDGYKLVTIFTSTDEDSITGLFNAGDVVLVSGITEYDMSVPLDPVLVTSVALNGFKQIQQGSNYSFGYKVPEEVITDYIITTGMTAIAHKKIFRPGVLINSIEQISHDENSGIFFIDSNYNVSGLNITGDCMFSIIDAALVGQEKKIFLKSSYSSGDKATISNINGAGFNTIVLETNGDSVTLMYEDDSWVCLTTYGTVTVSQE